MCSRNGIPVCRALGVENEIHFLLAIGGAVIDVREWCFRVLSNQPVFEVSFRFD